MKILILLLSLCMCVGARSNGSHTTTYHDTTITTQLSYVETETGYVQEVSTHTQITAPEEEKVSKRGKMIIRGITLITGCVMVGIASHSLSKANEYKELQGMSDFNNNIGMTNTADYTSQIEMYERRAGIMFGVGAGSFGIFGVTFFFQDK